MLRENVMAGCSSTCSAKMATSTPEHSGQDWCGRQDFPQGRYLRAGSKESAGSKEPGHVPEASALPAERMCVQSQRAHSSGEEAVSEA